MVSYRYDKFERRDANENSIACKRKSDRYDAEGCAGRGVARGTSGSKFYWFNCLRSYGGIKMERKENTPMRETRRRYEERNKEQRKQKSGNFGTMIPRGLFEEINSFLKRYGYTKVQLIEAGQRNTILRSANLWTAMTISFRASWKPLKSRRKTTESQKLRERGKSLVQETDDYKKCGNHN